MIGNNLLLAGTDEGYNLTRSLRFRSSASAYLSRTFGTPTNNKLFTVSFWVKRGALSGVRQQLVGAIASGAGAYWAIEFNANNGITIYDSNAPSSTALVTTAVYRDVSAWYHIVVVEDTTQATASNRTKLYVNGVQVTAFSTSDYATQNSNPYFNQSSATASIGSYNPYSVPNYFDGYLAEIHVVDGQTLTPSSFGETDLVTGVWKPKRYAGTYGTNGFYLPFTDNSALTTSSNAGLGKDFSGNGNYWATNNISITSGVTYDSMTDVPTLTSATAANFAVMNVLNGNPSNGSLSDGNLTGLTSSNGEGYWNSTIAIPSLGKWYWEFKFTTGGSGIRTAVTTTSMGTYSVMLNEGGRLYVNGVDQGVVASTYASTDVMGVAVDVSATTVKWYKNGTLDYTYTYTAQSLPMFAFGGKYSNPCYFNFGQQGFAYTPPTGYVALNTYNLSAGSVTTSGSFTGNSNADGTFVYLNGVPTAMTINGNAVTFGTHADKLANGFKVRTSSSSYNTTGSNTFSVSTNGAVFKYANAQGNP